MDIIDSQLKQILLRLRSLFFFFISEPAVIMWVKGNLWKTSVYNVTYRILGTKCGMHNWVVNQDANLTSIVVDAQCYCR